MRGRLHPAVSVAVHIALGVGGAEKARGLLSACEHSLWQALCKKKLAALFGAVDARGIVGQLDHKSN